MFSTILFTFVLVTSVHAQLNGEFWWLNSNINNLKKVRAPPPKIDFSDFQNDENAKIIFRDDDLFINKLLKPISDRTSKLIQNNNSGENKIVWPTEKHMENHDVEVFTDKNIAKENNEKTKPNNIQNKYEDVLEFDYPKNEKYVNVDMNKANTEPIHLSSTQSVLIETENENASTEVVFNTNKLSTTTTKDKESQNICTYIKKNKCYQLTGFVYEYSKRIPTTSGDDPLVCCILPIRPIFDKENLSHTIHFPSTASNLNRNKRSDIEENIALKQRDFLLKHKFSTQRQNLRPASTTVTKIVTPPEDDNVDPYWNIKNTKFQNPTNPTQENTKYDYYSEDYVHEYIDELPKPGLVGLYSDHAKSPSSWSFANGNKRFSYGGSDDDYEDDEDDDDDEDTFGYSTIDPRQGSKKQKGKPVKLTTTSDEVTYDAERHTINFQSNPDFHVFQGFKLLNLYRNKSRGHSKNTKRTSNQDQSIEALVSNPEGSEEIEEFFDESQLFVGCGKAMVKKVNERGNQIGETASGSHPWMALVVLTKRRHNILCYATLVHPRAAVTVADCVDGTAPGDITVIAGLWDLNDRSQSRNRVAIVKVHPRYKPGHMEDNLAVLYWMRPLQLSVNIQPACLGEPQIGDECKFFGWGGLDQEIEQQRSRWQRATIRSCTGRLGSNKRLRSSGEAFCVLASRGSVTGMGGPLICEVGGHNSIVGVVVSRENGYVLLPVQDWTMKTEKLISGD